MNFPEPDPETMKKLEESRREAMKIFESSSDDEQETITQNFNKI